MGRLEEIKTRCEAATIGPWEWWVRPGMSPILVQRSGGPQAVMGGVFLRGELDSPDAVFVAHARADVEWLIEQLEK